MVKQSMKKFINRPEDLVREQLEGFAAAHPELCVHFDPNYVRQPTIPAVSRVALISGGGSGHEPLHAGYVGYGMLAGACPGEIFTAPTPDQMIACAQTVSNGGGVLFVVKNYTGDVLGFETAIEMLHADGLSVGSILVDDDIALKHKGLSVGRRGTGAALLVEKIVGAAAVGEYDLDQCVELGQRINACSRTIGLALSSCIVPQRRRPTFELGADEVEIGIGIHGERGQSTIPLDSADNLVDTMATELFSSTTYQRNIREWDRHFGGWIERAVNTEPLRSGDRVIAIVNNMGGTPRSELYVVYRRLAAVCAQRDIHISRRLVGTYVTSLDMRGCSITLAKVDDEMLTLWDHPVSTPALRWGM